MIDVKIAGRTPVTARSVLFELVTTDGTPLPEWVAGTHITLRLPSGVTRQYSLCGDPADHDRYRIVVLGDDAGRGGSKELHALNIGDELKFETSHNNFPLSPAERYVLVAGGIGLTPIISMAWELHRAQRPFRVVFATRTVDAMRLFTLLPPACDLEIRLSSEGNRLDVTELVKKLEPGTALYCCGPAGMLDEVASWQHQLQAREVLVQMERFEASAATLAGHHSDEDHTFRVTFARMDESVDVKPDESILGCARRLGKIVDSSCEEGYCGTCETTVLAGEVDHRDDFLTEEEKSSGETMMICVSRAKADTLTLDL